MGLFETRQHGRGTPPWEGVWEEIADYIMPRKNSFGSSSSWRRAGDELIFDSTPTHALDILASSLGGLLTNPALPWFNIRARNKETGDQREVRAYLQEVRDRIVRLFNDEDTGFQTYVHELYLDVTLFGTSVMYVEADADCVVRFSARPLGEIYVAENNRGMVDTVFRRYELTARQAFQEWGDDCSEKVRTLAEEKPEEKVEIVHAVFPRTDRDPFGFTSRDFPWACLYLETDSKHLLEESGYLEMPYMVPRWAKASGEIYGRGPGLTALSDVRVLNAMSRTALMAAEKMSDPPLMVPDDGFLGPIHSGPGGLSYYRAGSRDRIEALPVTVDLRATETMMEGRRQSIRRIFLTDQLQPESAPHMTATETLIRQSEKMRVLGPVLGRMQTEFLGPLIHRVFNIMVRAGELPPLPQGLRRSELEVDYLSPIARAQRQYEAQALALAVQYLSPFVGTSDPYQMMDNFETDRIARHAAELFGTPSDYMRPAQEVEVVRQQRQALAMAPTGMGARQPGQEVGQPDINKTGTE
ncbi:MAG: head-tail connector protein [Proteobacteria bacterium]|nr:head-tail connector protein [Pseudomonadota bacterium]MBU1612324.1 head-tail connector protein [Pseudomonadota bacterium]